MIWASWLACAPPEPPARAVVTRAVLPEGSWDALSMDPKGACVRAADGRVACFRHDGRPVEGVPERAVALTGGPSRGCAIAGDAVTCWGGLVAPEIASPRDVAADERSACAVNDEGRVACTGDLAPAPEVAEVVELAVGAGTACARGPDATWCWGRRAATFPFERRGIALGRRGVCWIGDGAVLGCDVDLPGGTPDLDEVVAVALGDDHLCTTRSGGRVHCVGRDATVGVPPPEPLRDVAAGAGTTCGLRVADGSIACWGRHYVADVPSEGVLSVALTGTGGCAVLRGGGLSCFGVPSQATPRGLAGAFRGVSLERGQGCGLRADRVAECWGSPTQRGDDSLPGHLAQVDAGIGVAIGLTDAGEVVTRGALAGALGAAPPGPWEAVGAGALWACAVGGGRVACWGPKAGPPPDKGPWTAVSVGQDHACGLRADGRASCWGRRFWRVPDVRFVRIAAGEAVNCGLDADGAMHCWGKVGRAPPAGRYVDLAVSTSADADVGSMVCGRTAAGALDCALL